MARIGTLIVRLLAQTKGFNRSLAGARKEIEKTEEATRRMAQGLAIGMAVAGSAAAYAGAKAVQAAAQWEMQAVAFGTLLDSAERAHGLLSELETLSHQVAFEMPALALGARRMLALGWATKNVVPDIRAVGDAAAAMGGGAEEIKRIIRALGQMRAKGRVTAEEMNLQLAEIGIPAWKYLAEAIGTDIPTALQMVERRQISSDFGVNAILRGMEKDFAGAMTAQADTALGSWRIMINQVATITRGFGAYLIDAFDLDVLMKSVRRILQPIADEIAKATDAADAFRRILSRTFTPEITKGIVILGGAAGGILARGFLLAGGAIAKAAAALVPFMIKGAAVAITAYTIYRNWSAIGAAIISVAKVIVHAIAGAVGALGVFIPSLRGVSQSMAAWANNLGVVQKTASGMNDMRGQAEAVAARYRGVKQSAYLAADAQQELGEKTKEAARAANRNIMAFDQVHQLQEDISAAAGAAVPKVAMPHLGEGMQMPHLQIPDITKQLGALDYLAEGFNNVKTSAEKLGPVFNTVGYIISGIVIAKITMLIGKLYALGKKSMATSVLVVKSWLLKKIGVIIAINLIIGRIAFLIAQYKLMAAIALAKIKYTVFLWLMMAKAAMASALKTASAWAMQALAATKAKIAMIPAFILMIAKWGLMAIKATIAAAKLAAAWLIAIAPVALVITAVVGIAALVIANWDRIRNWTIKTWSTIVTWLRNTWDRIRNDVIAPFNSLRNLFTSVWNNIEKTITTAVNNMLKPINLIINIIKEALGWVDKLAKTKLELPKPAALPSVPVAHAPRGQAPAQRLPNVPGFQRGGVVMGNKPTLALLHPPEAIVPLKGGHGGDGGGDFGAMVSNAIYSAIREAMRAERIAQGGAGRQDIVLEIDGVKLGRLVLSSMVREGNRTGLQIVEA